MPVCRAVVRGRQRALMARHLQIAQRLRRSPLMWDALTGVEGVSGCQWWLAVCEWLLLLLRAGVRPQAPAPETPLHMSSRAPFPSSRAQHSAPPPPDACIGLDAVRSARRSAVGARRRRQPGVVLVVLTSCWWGGDRAAALSPAGRWLASAPGTGRVPNAACLWCVWDCRVGGWAGVLLVASSCGVADLPSWRASCRHRGTCTRPSAAGLVVGAMCRCQMGQ
jgi:hypothetical protein